MDLDEVRSVLAQVCEALRAKRPPDEAGALLVLPVDLASRLGRIAEQAYRDKVDRSTGPEQGWLFSSNASAGTASATNPAGADEA